MTRTAVIDHPELFSEREFRALGAPPRPNAHDVFEPDETLAVFAHKLRIGPGGKSRPLVPVAEIRLVQIPGKGWLFAWSYSLSQCGCGFAPSLKWRDTLRPTRQEAIDAARADMVKSIASQRETGRCKLGRLVSNWLASDCGVDPP